MKISTCKNDNKAFGGLKPGIYIPNEKMGIRLEDDVVVQADGPPLNLMQHIPIEIEEIEGLMNSN